MPELRIAVLGIAGRWSTEVLADRIAERTGYRRIIDPAELVLELPEGHLHAGNLRLDELDGLVVKKLAPDYGPEVLDRLALLRAAELAGVRVFSPVASMAGLINRASCTLSLAAAGMPMPRTLLTEHSATALEAIQQSGTMISKPLYSSKARGMAVLEGTTPNLEAQLAESRPQPLWYLQERCELPGRDLGLVFVGGRYLCAYARVAASGSWNTTIAAGGRYEAATPDAELVNLARRAQAVFELDFTTVDLAETPQGPVVFEVSAFGGFRGAWEGCGLDAAAAYADHILASLDGAHD